ECDAVDDDELGPLGELRPHGEDALVLARRIFADGRTRAYAWGRAAAREDVAAVAERLVAMSGQFEQRRLARGSYRLAVLDAFAEVDVRPARAAWRELQTARRTWEELTRDAAAARARLDELRALGEELRGFLASLEAEPRRLEEVEAELDRIADAKRRHRAQTYVELLERAGEARRELEALDAGHDPVGAADEAVAAAQARVDRVHAEL